MARGYRTPLAWRNLTHDVRRLAVAVSGVAFAVILIFMELGFLNALLESTVQLLRKLDGDIVMISSAKYALVAATPFDARRIDQALDVPGVANVYPIYMESVTTILRREGENGHPVRVLAFRENDPVFNIPQVQATLDQLRQAHFALADARSRPKYHFPTSLEGIAAYRGELNGKRLQLAGQFELGVDFATEANLIMTANNFAKYFPQRAPGRGPLSQVDLGVVKIEKGADINDVIRRLSQTLPHDVEVLPKEELVYREMLFWQRNAPLGYIFMVGATMGFVVGVVICYQIIYADISDHMREFATLKAMGYRPRFFVGLVLRQCLYMSILGFIPGAAVSAASYAFLASYTGLTMLFTWPLALGVFLVTAVMSTVSGLLAINKLLAADPAELF